MTKCICGTTRHKWPKHADWCEIKDKESAPKEHNWGTFNVLRDAWRCDDCGFELTRKAQASGVDQLPPCKGKP